MIVIKHFHVYKSLIRQLRTYSFLICFMLVYTGIYAQSEAEPPVLDTLRTEEVPVAEDDTEISVVEEEKVDYFLPKDQMQYGVVDSFKFKHLRNSDVLAMKQDEDFWYADMQFNSRKPQVNYKRQQRRSESLSQHPAFQSLLWILTIGGFLAFLVIYLMNSNVNIFRRTANIEYEADEDVMTDDIFSISYDKEIAKATAAGNYRLSIRLLFLRMLRNLSYKSIIDYKQDRTNLDYLLQLQKSNYFHDFLWLTRNYEYSWYGQFPVDQEKFQAIKKEFENFDQKLNY